MGDPRDQSIMSVVPKMEITVETKYGDSNIAQSSRQYFILSKTEITTSGAIQVKLEPSESDPDNKIDSQIISSSHKNEIDMEIEERTVAPIRCLHCTPPRIFNEMSGLKSHQIFVHNIPTEPFQCAQCSAKCLDAESLNRHELIRHGGRFSCDQCPKSFSSFHCFYDHIESVHSKSDRKMKSKEPVQFLKKKIFEEKQQRWREQREEQRLRTIATMGSGVKKTKQTTSTNIDREISAADHASNSKEATTSNLIENSASTSSNVEELPLVCFLCPRRFESEQAMNTHLTVYHRIERSDID